MSQQPNDCSFDDHLHHARWRTGVICAFLLRPPEDHLIQQATNDITRAHGQEFPLPLSPITLGPPSPAADPTAVLALDVPAAVPVATHPAEEPNRCCPPPGRCAGNFKYVLTDSSYYYRDKHLMLPLSGPHECIWSGRKLTILCTTCGKVFPRKSDFNRHYKNLHDKTLYHCPFPGCSSVFARRDNIIPHRRSAHGEIIEVRKAAPPGSRVRARARAAENNRDGAQNGNMDVAVAE
ncbi:hypothetical protein P167DRAFT_549778 [Morchella conica CCBAS932]|uniref:C2H2-type domain-containing protein n=1 Tax=Morchella conica CCBAS932 TaxID=1392247 RepID=A0A3N4KD27_9PEZI|nr:hypothetical protein P167DRAFT_549778 [Morchella conica CCBAS932]